MKLLLYLMTRLKVDNSWASMLFYLYQMNARWFVVIAIVTQEKSPQLENRKLEVSSHVFLHKCYRRQLIKRLSFFTGRDYNHYSLKLFRGERGHWEMRGRGKKTNKLEIILKHLKMYLIWCVTSQHKEYFEPQKTLQHRADITWTSVSTL